MAEEKIMFKDVALEWLESRKHNVKPVSYYTYENMINGVILPIVGEMSIAEVCESSYCQSLEYNLRQVYADDTVDNIFVIMKCVIKHYQALRMDVEKLGTTRRFYDFSFSEARRIISKANEGRMKYQKLGELLIMYTGITISELSALTWNCIDLENGLIFINETAYRAKNSQGKTEIIFEDTLPRQIPISAKLRVILEKYKAYSGGGCDHFVLTNSSKVMEPRTFQIFLKTFFKDGYEKGELLKIRTANEMRSMFIVLALKKGFSAISLAKVTGVTVKHLFKKYEEYIHIPDVKNEMNKIGY